ncbi:cysteine hydrolase family protein [Komagataeibacter sucrofermentans]|uniref:Isochorismatase n=1 Tax=Komagataeibacter sucrofermentans TaxID=1053551 RepID=A0A318QJB9_9PROT|nr:cysteine hydrolase family protein [Komagataeibacter sucrofermentans]PYD77468.1 isochorismatase [Komagataeibacter sucrofermentans]GBQ47504.1 isochorismatase [Komagataeibacter sucrofermentans DSM 15973]
MSDHTLIIIDLQNDYFPGGRWPLVGIEEAAANAGRVLAQFRETGRPVIHIQHEFESSDAPFFVPGSVGAQINERVLPENGEPVVLKHHPNAFRDTELKTLLDRQGIRQLTVLGAMSHVCIDATVRAAVDLGYDVTVVHDAIATRDLAFNETAVPAKQVHVAYMAALAFAYAKVIPTREIIHSSE